MYVAADAPPVLGRLLTVASAGESAALRFEVMRGVGVAPVAGPLSFEATLDGVQLRFSCEQDGPPESPTQLPIRFPIELLRIQRRRFARLEAPLGLPFVVEFALGGKPCVLGVDNIARGGIGLRASPKQAALLYVGRRLPRAWIELGHGERFQAELEIRSRRIWQTFLLGQQYVVGCRFIDLSVQAEAEIERVLAQLERQMAAGSGQTELHE